MCLLASCETWLLTADIIGFTDIVQEPAAARPKLPPGRRHVAPGRQQQHGVVSITEELAHAPPANRPARSRGFVLNPMCAIFTQRHSLFHISGAMLPVQQ